MYACKNATSNSIKSIKRTKNIETGATAKESNMNMRHIRLKITMWPASMLANNRIIRAKGFENNPHFVKIYKTFTSNKGVHQI